MAAALVFLGAFSSTGLAQAGSGERGVPAVSLRETAVVLARSGAANNDPRTVLAAAQIVITAERASPGLERVALAAEQGLRPAEAAKVGDLTAADLLRLASRISVEQLDAGTASVAAHLAANPDVGLGDSELGEELRRAAEALASVRGAEGGPVWADGYLAAGDVAEFRLAFEGGYVPNRISVSASNRLGDLDCYLYEGDQLVARDADYRGACAIAWSQKLKGTMILRVRNTGAATYYVLVSN
jgi:hypothetical protein